MKIPWSINIPFIKETFGETFNFLYRVFSIFTIGSILVVFLSKYLNSIGKGKVHEYDLEISLSGIGGALLGFSITQIPFILLAITHVISPQMVATPASIVCMGLFLWYLKREKEEIPFYESDILQDY
ncbi:MAG: hypothetical protein QE277_08795 [Flectobacillus sp.]|jgi:SSS family solute:Na+ symporter|nr:hypothetical protein [Flectobacillus sp.]